MEVGERDQTEVDEAVRLRVTRRAVHDVGFLFFVRHGDGRNHVGAEIDAQDEHRGERQRQLGGDVAEERRNLRNVGRERVSDRLLEVIEDETTFFNTVDDGGKVVIHENHVGGFLGNILTGDTHGDTNVTLLEGRSVVDTVTGDGDDFTTTLAVFDNQKLVSRRHASPNNLLVVESGIPLFALFNRIFNFGPGTNIVTLDDAGAAVVEVLLGDNVHLLGNGGGSDRVITSHHVNLDASAVALHHSFRHAFTRRIDEREQADEGKVVDREVRLRLLGKLEVILEAGEFLEGKAEDAFAAAAELLVRVGVRVFEFSILRRSLAVGEVRRALGQHTLRGTLQHEKRRASTRLLVNGELPLVRRVELDLKELRVFGASLESIVDRLDELEQTLLGSVTGRRLLEHVEVRVHHLSLEVNERTVFVLGQVLGVVTQGGNLEETLERFRRLVVERLAVRSLTRFRDNLEVRNVLTSRAEVNLAVVPRVLDSHTVLRKRTRLVRRNHGGGTESFDGFEVLHENVLRVHALGRQGQRHSHGGEETFRHVGDDDTNHEDDVLDDRRAVRQTDDEEDDTESNGHDGDELNELLNLLGDRRVFVARFGGETRDLTHHGAVSGADDDTAAGTRVNDGGVEAKVGRLKRLRDDLTLGVERELRGAVLRLGLTRERRVVNLELVRAHDANVSRHLVTVVEFDNVTRNEFPGINDDSLATADSLALLRNHILETFHNLLRLGLLQKGEGGGDHNDGEEDDTEVKVGLVLFRVDGITDKAEHTATEEQECEKVGKLQQKLDVPRSDVRRRESVLAILGAVLEHTLVSQTVFQRTSKVREELVLRPRVFDKVDILTQRRGALFLSSLLRRLALAHFNHGSHETYARYRTNVPASVTRTKTFSPNHPPSSRARARDRHPVDAEKRIPHGTSRRPRWR